MKQLKQSISPMVILLAGYWFFGGLTSHAASPLNPVTTSELTELSNNAKASAQATKPATDKDFLISYQANINLAYQLRLKKLNAIKQINIDTVVSHFSQSPYLQDKKYVKNAVAVIEDGDRVVGAGAVDTNLYYPDCVAIQSKRHFFSGTLIAKNLILTAAHCYESGSNYTVFIGYDATKPTSTIVVPGGNFYTHPQYSPTGLPKNDVALLYLGQNMLSIRPRRLASPGAVSSAQSVTLVGFGYSDVGGTIGLGVRRIGYAPIAGTTGYGADPATEIVAGNQLLHVDTCYGDSGGPIYIGDNGDPSDQYLAGCTSRGVTNRDGTVPNPPCGNGGIYERSDAFIPWIKQMAAQLNCVLPN